MAVNMEVAEASRVADTRLSTTDPSAELRDVNSEIKDDTLKSERSRRANITGGDNEESVDARSTNNGFRVDAADNGNEKREEKREDTAANTSRATSEDRRLESSEGVTENANGRHISHSPLAFTIDFGNSREVDTAKYQNLFERYNARHRRNLSTSKVEVKSKKPNAILSPNLVQKQKVPSTHSEGYFSSEDDSKRKTDQLSERLKQLGIKNPLRAHSSTKKSRDEHVDPCQNKQYLMTRSCDDELQHKKMSPQGLSLELESNENVYWESPRSATINDLSRVQISNYDDDENEKQYTKNIEYINIDRECKEVNGLEDNKVSNMNYITDDFNIKNTNEKENNSSSISYTMDLNADDIADTNLDVFNVSNVDAGSDGAVSEAGTYTIHKDYTDEEKARMDIDKVFSVGVLTEDESNEAYVHNFKMSISRDNNAWISEWATQVAEHNSLPPIIGGSTGRTPPLSPSKIPSPIHTRSQRVSRNRYEQSDGNLNTDTYVRIKERIGLVSSQHQIIDSGGESDDDTSNSYNTPPNSSQRTPVHNVARRGSLSESLFRRANSNENRRSVRKYLSSTKSKTADTNVELLNSPSRVLSPLHLQKRSNSLDRKEYASDTTESNTSRRNSMKYKEEDFKHTNSPILNRLRPPTPKLTNSPIVNRKAAATKILNSPMLERPKHLAKSSQAKNIGYFTCVENSPYMLRKSNSTTNYHEGISYFDKDVSIKAPNILRNSPEFQRHLNIQRSSSNASIRNVKSQNFVSRRSSFNSCDIDRISSRGKFVVASDSSSEAGEQQRKSPLTPISSGIKLNRAFSIRRARLNCESDTTPNTTPEERRKKAQQSEVKTIAPANKQQSYHRSRTNSVGTHSKESSKKSESTKFRTPSISRTDTGRFSMRASKPTHHPASSQKTNQKSSKDHKKSGRSNSTLTSKEVEFQNWKRRKSYDPMKAAAEGRRKLIDSTKKHHSTEDGSGNHDNSVLRSASFHGTGGTLSLANDWSDNELNYSYEDNQVPPPSSPQLESDSDLETSSYLQETQNVVSAMSARMTGYCRPLDSDNESDEDTSHSLRQNISKGLRHPSDTESSDERHPMAQSPISNTKYNKELSLRRAKLDLQRKPMSSNVNKAKNISHDARSKSESLSSFNKTDSGRPSARANRALSMGPRSKPKEQKKPPTPNVREVEMQNWKRRKSYDPMKAAMEGRRKAGLAKKNINANLSPSHVARSQSFHGSVGLVVSDWSDEEPVISADEASFY